MTLSLRSTSSLYLKPSRRSPSSPLLGLRGSLGDRGGVWKRNWMKWEGGKKIEDYWHRTGVMSPLQSTGVTDGQMDIDTAHPIQICFQQIAVYCGLLQKGQQNFSRCSGGQKSKCRLTVNGAFMRFQCEKFRYYCSSWNSMKVQKWRCIWDVPDWMSVYKLMGILTFLLEV